MTGYTVHTGSSEKFSEGWDRVFQTGKSSSKAKSKPSGGRTSSKPQRRRKKKK